MGKIYCAVYGCNYSSDKKKNPKVWHKYPGIQDTSFFAFPSKITKPKLRKLWVHKCRRADFFSPKKHNKICSRHFSPQMVQSKNDSGYPTLFSHNNFGMPINPRTTQSTFVYHIDTLQSLRIGKEETVPNQQIENDHISLKGGNQRELARAKKAKGEKGKNKASNDQEANKGLNLPDRKQRDADKMREKQLAAEAKKAEEGKK